MRLQKAAIAPSVPAARPRGLAVRARAQASSSASDAASVSRRLLLSAGAVAATSIVLPGGRAWSAQPAATSAYDFSALMYEQEFGGQAPGSSEEERVWAFKKFGFEFDVYDKIEVNGNNAHPLYKYLRQQQPISTPYDPKRSSPLKGGALEWNYVKFLVDRNGQAVKRYKPAFDPLEFEDDVRLVLAGKAPLPPECAMHPGRKVCNTERLLQEA